MKPKLQPWQDPRSFDLWERQLEEDHTRAVNSYPYERHNMRKVPVQMRIRLWQVIVLTIIATSLLLLILRNLFPNWF